MQNIKEIEEKCYSDFARFIFEQYYKEMLKKKREELGIKISDKAFDDYEDE